MTDDMVEKVLLAPAFQAGIAAAVEAWKANSEFAMHEAMSSTATAVIDALHVREMREALKRAKDALTGIPEHLEGRELKASAAEIRNVRDGLSATLALLNPQQEASDA